MKTCRVLKFEGDIDIALRPSIERKLAQIERFEDGTLVILDLTNLRYADMSFLNTLMRFRNRLAEQKRDVRICLAASQGGIVHRIFQITQLDLLFPIFNDMRLARQGWYATAPSTRAASA